MEKEVATHSSRLARNIPWTKQPCGLQSMGSQRVGRGLATKHTCRMRPTAEAARWHISDTFLLVSFHNVLAQQDETKSYLPSFSPSTFPPSYPHPLRLPLQFQICFTCQQVACPISKAPRISRCVPQGIWEIKCAYAPGTTASTGQSSLCSPHPDDFLFKIHLEGIV